MSLKAGIVGLPNVGKSTLFNAITSSQVEAANYPFATIEPNVGIVELPDDRLEKLANMVKPQKLIHATFEFIDIAGLVAGASKGEGLGNKFLSNIREVDAIVQVVRCFSDQEVTHIAQTVDPIRDMEIINLELILADLDTCTKVLARVQKKAINTKSETLIAEANLAQKIKDALMKNIPGRMLNLSIDEIKIAQEWHLLTLKPLIYVANVDEKFVASPEESNLFQIMEKEASRQQATSLAISAKIEGELAQLEGDDKQLFLDDLKIVKSGLDRLTRATFNLLNLATYFTVGIKEVKAWTFHKNMKAPQCAGIIHSDFERGFIKAEVVSYQDFIDHNGEQGAKSAGKYRLEGKNYIFKDGDIANFKFNV